MEDWRDGGCGVASTEGLRGLTDERGGFDCVGGGGCWKIGGRGV
jgi:hypothetical protein